MTRSLPKQLSKMELMRIRLLRGNHDDSLIDEAAKLRADILEDQVELVDNRDFKTVPNLQSQGEATIWDHSQMGPRPNVRLASPHDRLESLKSSLGTSRCLGYEPLQPYMPAFSHLTTFSPRISLTLLR